MVWYEKPDVFLSSLARETQSHLITTPLLNKQKVPHLLLLPIAYSTS